MPIAPFEKKADGDAVSSFFPFFYPNAGKIYFSYIVTLSVAGTQELLEKHASG